MTTDERLTKLEKQLARGRRLNRCLLAALCLCLTAWALVAALQPKTALAQATGAGANVVRATRFILEDDNGNIRAALSMIEGGPRLALFDESGNCLVALSATYNDPRLAFRDNNGALSSFMSRSYVSLLAQGASVSLEAPADGGVGLFLTELGPESTSSTPDPVENALERPGQISSVRRGGLFWTAGGPMLTLADENESVCALLIVSEDGPKLNLADENGTPRTCLGVESLMLYDASGAATAVQRGSSLGLFTQGASIGLSALPNDLGLHFYESKPAPTSLLCRASFVWRADGPSLMLVDDNGTVRALLGVNENGPVLDLADENGKGRAMIGTGTTTLPDGTEIAYPESTFMLFGPDEKTIWQAP